MRQRGPGLRQGFDSSSLRYATKVTDGSLWAEFDAQSVGLGVMERELRENLFGDEVWMALEPAARTFIATAEKIFRDHRSDPAFAFGPVIGNFSAVGGYGGTAVRR
jgi:hypothetical protein